MRGKLRDKRTDMKRESMKLKREYIERRRNSSKRENRNLAWQNLQVDQEEEYLLDKDEELLYENSKK